MRGPTCFGYPDRFIRKAVFCGDLINGLPPLVKRGYAAIRLRWIPTAIIKVEIQVVHIMTVATSEEVSEEKVLMWSILLNH